MRLHIEPKIKLSHTKTRPSDVAASKAPAHYPNPTRCLINDAITPHLCRIAIPPGRGLHPL
jgi:hypothetical protein